MLSAQIEILKPVGSWIWSARSAGGSADMPSSLQAEVPTATRAIATALHTRAPSMTPPVLG
jgi:hypothetical protein